MTKSRPAHRNRFRIIGGYWRSRRLSFPSGSTVRPTPDRIRETLFNWLQPAIAGARCLDLFAGSGALGLEALSRGASGVVFVEQDATLAAGLRANLQRLGTKAGSVIVADARDWLRQPAQPFDAVFLDPPFAGNLLEPCCVQLAAGTLLAPGARIYLEHAVDHEPRLPPGWTVVRRSHAGRVACELAIPDQP